MHSGCRGRMNEPWADNTESTRNQLDQREQVECVLWIAVRQLTAGKRAQAEPEHESRHNDGHRLEVDAHGLEQQALPADLVDESGNTGDEKQADGPVR